MRRRRDVKRSGATGTIGDAERRLFDDPLIERMFSKPLRLAEFRVVRSLEDRRTFHPAGPLRPAVSFPRDAARRVAKSSAVMSKRDDISSRVGFAVPERVAVCVRRKQRKEVLHALRKTGSGVSRVRRRNIWSDVDC